MIDKLTMQLEYFKRTQLDVSLLRDRVLHSKTPLDAARSSQVIDSCDDIIASLDTCIIVITKHLEVLERMSDDNK